MTIRDILLHVDDQPACSRRIQLALELAQRWQSVRLRGLYIMPEITVPTFAESFITPEMIQQQQRERLDQASRCAAQFNALCSEHNFVGEWLQCDGEPLDVLELYGRCADLTIVGQSDPDHSDYGGSDRAEQLVLGLGAPVLVVPYVPVTSQAQRILVAWDGSREAARALRDSLAVLHHAEQVEVISVGLDLESSRSPEAVVQHLALHQISARAHHQPHVDRLSISDLLLSYAFDQGFDLLVMGAYGHARWREQVLGGVTRSLFDQMTLPVLMTH